MKHLDLILKAFCIAIFITNISANISLLSFGLFCLFQQSSLTILSLGNVAVTHTRAKTVWKIYKGLNGNITKENIIAEINKHDDGNLNNFQSNAYFLYKALSWLNVHQLADFKPKTIEEAIIYATFFPNKNLTSTKQISPEVSNRQEFLDFCEVTFFLLETQNGSYQMTKQEVTAVNNFFTKYNSADIWKAAGFNLQHIYYLTDGRAKPLLKEFKQPEELAKLERIKDERSKTSLTEKHYTFRAGYARNLETQLTISSSSLTYMLQVGNQYKIKFKSNYASLCLYFSALCVYLLIPTIYSALSLSTYITLATFSSIGMMTAIVLCALSFFKHWKHKDFITINLGHDPFSPGGHFFLPNPKNRKLEYSIGVITLNVLITALLFYPLTTFGAMNLFSVISPYTWLILLAITTYDRVLAILAHDLIAPVGSWLNPGIVQKVGSSSKPALSPHARLPGMLLPSLPSHFVSIVHRATFFCLH